MKWIAALLGAALLAACAGTNPQPARSGPVVALDADFPDPAVMRASDGYYYAYATQGQSQGRMHNIQLARSRDLARWEPLGDALPVKPGWASKTQDFWAPHVIRDGDRYVMYYSAKPDAALTDTTRGLCLAVATATRPEGPFKDIDRPLLCGPGFVNIDPMAYDDPATGRRLLYWGSGFGPIKVQELAADRLSFVPGSSAVDLVAVIKTDDPANYRRLVEGAWMIHRKGWYYLFFSGDNCCGPNAHYAVMVARSRSATGPFEVKADRGGVMLEASPGWVAPGHNSAIVGPDGDWRMIYHAVDAAQPRRQPSDDVNTRRIMLVERLEWVEDWPEVRRRP